MLVTFPHPHLQSSRGGSMGLVVSRARYNLGGPGARRRAVGAHDARRGSRVVCVGGALDAPRFSHGQVLVLWA